MRLVVRKSEPIKKGGLNMATAIRRYDPFRDLVSIQSEMNRLFGNTFGGLEGSESSGSWAPALDVYQGEDSFTVVTELPGMNSGDVDISIEDNVLSIRGERKFYDSVSEDSFHRIERRYGQFLRRISLPQHSDTSRIEASMKDGLLTVTVPKSEQAKPKRIEVKASES